MKSGINGGNPKKVLLLVRKGEVEMFISPFIMDKFEKILRKKFKWSEIRIKQARRKIKEISISVNPREKIDVIKEKDSDNRILECAIEAEVDFLITGDTRHLQPLKQYKGIKILSPKEFITLLFYYSITYNIPPILDIRLPIQ
jgi:putative PIN family toxin of toxin-antitoxin system